MVGAFRVPVRRFPPRQEGHGLHLSFQSRDPGLSPPKFPAIDRKSKGRLDATPPKKVGPGCPLSAPTSKAVGCRTTRSYSSLRGAPHPGSESAKANLTKKCRTFRHLRQAALRERRPPQSTETR